VPNPFRSCLATYGARGRAARALLVGGLLAPLAFAATSARAQTGIVIPNQMHKSLTFELHSVRDEVQLYEGDPQYLLQLEVLPERSLPPKTEFSIANQVALVRVRDLFLFEEQPEPDVAADPDLGLDEKNERPPVSQKWILKVLPSSATDFVLQCDGGKAILDFTDLPVQSLHLLADSTEVKIDWNRPNLVPLERLKITARSADVTFRGLLNSRPRVATLQLDQSKCEIDLTGQPCQGEGESDIFFEGVPARLRMTVSKHIGLRLEGSFGAIAHFDQSGMIRKEMALESTDYATRKCRVWLHFSQAVPKLEVRWED
jgi:hypothetical protein